MKKKRHKAILLSGALIALMIYGISALGIGSSIPSAQSQPSYETDTIYTAQEAITAALTMYPEYRNHYSETAKLTTYSSLDAWRGVSSPGTSPNSLVWCVAMLGNGVKKYDIVYLDLLGYDGRDDHNLPQDIWSDTADDRIVEGAFYTFDATSGSPVGHGILEASSSLNFASFQAIPTVSAAIVTATPIPPPTPGGAGDL